MKRNIYAVLVLLGALSLVACEERVDPSSTITTETIEIGGYSGIRSSSAFDVEVYYSDDEYVLIQTNENLHEYVQVFNEDGILFLRVDNDLNTSGSSVFKAKLYTKSPLKLVIAKEASRININDALFADNVDLELSGASYIHAEVKEVESIKAALSKASNLHLEGQSESFLATLSGASRLSDGEVECNTAVIDLSGASSAEVSVNRELSITASGASVLRYTGDAIIKEISLTGNSTIEKI